MAETESLKEIIRTKLLSTQDNLMQANANLDIHGVLESLEILTECVVLLDSFESVSEQVFNFLMQAHNVLSRCRFRNTNIHRDTNERNTVGPVGRPSLNISKEQIEYLMIATFQSQK